MEIQNNCDNCKYAYLDNICQPCSVCYSFANWKPKEEPYKTLEEYLKQRDDLNSKIEELQNKDLSLLIKVRDILQLYTDRDHKISSAVKNIYILEQKEDIYVSLPDLLTAIEEGRLEINEDL